MEYVQTSFSTIKPFDLQRNMIAHMTVKSWQNIPHVAYLYEPDITDFFTLYKGLASDFSQQGIRLSFNTIIMKAIVEGLKAAPEMNAHLSYDYLRGKGQIKISNTINIGIAWTLPDDRMITPILFNTQVMDLKAMSHAVADLEQRISTTNIDELVYQAVKHDTLEEIRKFNPAILKRLFSHLGKIERLRSEEKREYYRIPANDRLTPKDLLEATITLSNIGSLYKDLRGSFNVLEIIPPQVAALGIGAVQEKPGIYLDDQGQSVIGPRKILPINVVFDHRALDFKAVIPFIRRLDEIFAHPEEIKSW